MHEILRTNSPIVMSFVRSLLDEEGIESVELDSQIASLEGSVGGIQCRLVVEDLDADRAQSLLADANLDY